MKRFALILWLLAPSAHAGGENDGCFLADANNEPNGIIQPIVSEDWQICAIFQADQIATKVWSVRMTVGPEGVHIQEYSLSSENSQQVSDGIFETCVDVSVGAPEIVSVVRGASGTADDVIPVRACALSVSKE